LQYLEKFSFTGNIYSVQEGEIVFPNEPVLRVEADIIEAQIIETLLLNILNFQSLIATKASRMRQVAGDKLLIDFGLRRAQGLGGIHASKAAIIGGFDSTSNLYSAMLFDLNASGTLAHAFIQSYDQQVDAFRAFAALYPEKTILLVDTYDTLSLGVPDAIQVAKEMEERGHRLFGIRLDSGDFSYLSKMARKMLDNEELQYVNIFVSNQLDEYIIKSLLEQKAPIDGFGVGTSLVTGKEDGALDGVYKLAMFNDKPRLKISEDTVKILLPGIKNIIRYLDEEGMFYGDGIMLENESSIKEIYNPNNYLQSSRVESFLFEPIMFKVIGNGKMVIQNKMPKEIAVYCRQRLNSLPDEFKRLENPHLYKVGVSKNLYDLRSRLIQSYKGKERIEQRKR
jgi:nicotinate phosphoribosyltransferase